MNQCLSKPPLYCLSSSEEKKVKKKKKKRVGNTESSEKKALRVVKSLKCRERCATVSRDYAKQHPKPERADSTHIAFDEGKIGHMRPQTCKQSFQQHKQKIQNFAIAHG